MHAHVSYLSDDCPACLFMLTVDRDAFFELSEAKKKIVAVSSFFKSLHRVKEVVCLTLLIIVGPLES